VIAELDRYHGVVLRQLLVAHGQCVRMGVANLSGRVDAFCIDSAAFQIKYSSKRLPPWRFTYATDNLAELVELRRTFNAVWVFLVCGEDGILGLSLDELASIAPLYEERATWVRVSRNRNSMYRVSGLLGELPRAKPRGVQEFLAEVFSLGSEVA